MKRQAHSEPATEQQVYRGREFAGTIMREGDRYLALDADDRRLGIYATSRAAFAAVLAQSRPGEGIGQ